MIHERVNTRERFLDLGQNPSNVTALCRTERIRDLRSFAKAPRAGSRVNNPRGKKKRTGSLYCELIPSMIHYTTLFRSSLDGFFVRKIKDARIKQKEIKKE